VIGGRSGGSRRVRWRRRRDPAVAMAVSMTTVDAAMAAPISPARVITGSGAGPAGSTRRSRGADIAWAARAGSTAKSAA
jgi:hypothetical protein